MLHAVCRKSYYYGHYERHLVIDRKCWKFAELTYEKFDNYGLHFYLGYSFNSAWCLQSMTYGCTIPPGTFSSRSCTREARAICPPIKIRFRKERSIQPYIRQGSPGVLRWCLLILMSEASTDDENEVREMLLLWQSRTDITPLIDIRDPVGKWQMTSWSLRSDEPRDTMGKWQRGHKSNVKGLVFENSTTPGKASRGDLHLWLNCHLRAR